MSVPISYRAEARNAMLRSRREIITPEGIPISFTLASVGDRAVALVLDLVLLLTGYVVIGLLAWQTLGADFESDSWLLPLIIILMFLIQNFYFAFFEVKWQGATPGKRWLGLRVIDGHGGQLEASAVLARNLMRELEVWIPLRFLLGGMQLYSDAPSWAKLLAGAWMIVFAAFPLFNKDRLRVGDLVAGTRVVVRPKTVLVADLADSTMSGHALFVPPPALPVYQPPPAPGLPAPVPAPVAAPAAAPAGRRQPTFTFTEAQLGVYGEYELQVLEGVIRDVVGLNREETLAVVADKIQTKIGYEPRVQFGHIERFLRDFYAAQRAHLEKRMLFGKRKADKFKK